MSSEQKPSQERMLNTIKKHEKLIELAKKLNSFGKITEVIFTKLSDVITPNEKILLCFYQLQTGNKYFEDGSTVPQISSCELSILTTQNFITLTFLQTQHTINVKNIDHISELNVLTLFGSRYDTEAEIGAEENSFNPTQLKISYVFNNARGEKVATWDIDTMDEQNIKALVEQTKVVSQYIGVPLSKVQF
jgi:hypothetical protein